MVVNLAEEVLSGVLQTAEHLHGSVVAAEAGAVEALRWAGALPLLMRDLSVTKVVSTDALWACRSAEQVTALLRTPDWSERWEQQQPEDEQEPARIDPIAHVVVVVTGFLWDYEARLVQLLELGAVQRLTVCSSLSERAHECYDFERSASFFGASGRSRKMDFQAFASLLGAHNACAVLGAPSQQSLQTQQAHPVGTQATGTGATFASPTAQAAKDDGNDDDDEWGWTDESNGAAASERDTKSYDHAAPTASASSWSSAPTPPSYPLVTVGVTVVHLPLHFAPLLSSKAHAHEPSVFVLSHPLCATAFPLLLSDVVRANRSLTTAASVVGTSTMTNAVAPLPAYTHVRDVQPEHIPSAFRRSLKLLAHTLGEMLVSMRLDFKERIFAHGATSLKIGHTLVRCRACAMQRSGGRSRSLSLSLAAS